MSRPTSMKRDTPLYFTISVYDSDGILVDADSNPSCSTRKNGFITGDIVSVIKRTSSTGTYDCVYNPAGEIDTDMFVMQEDVTIGGTTYTNTWSFTVVESQPQGFGNVSVDTNSGAIGADLLAIFSANLQPTSGSNSAMADRFAQFFDVASGSNRTIETIARTSDVPSSSSITADVWDKPAIAHQTAGTFGAALNYVASPSFDAAIADAVWDETAADHAGIGTTGSALHNAAIESGLIKIVTDKLDTALEADGASGWQYTTLALENGGSGGGGGDATLANQNLILANIAAIDSDVQGLGTITTNTNTVVNTLNDFDPATQQVVASNMRGTDSALLASAAPSNWSTLIVGTGADLGKVTTSNPASGGGSAHTAQDVANLILAVPTTPLSNTASGSLALVDTTTNLTNAGSGGDDAATIYSYFTNGNNEDVFKANVSGMAQESSVNAVGTAVAAVNSLVQLTPTNTYSFFTSGSNENVFKADVSALATSANLQSVSLVTLDTNTKVNALNDITPTDVWNHTDINGILPKSAQLQANYLFNINIETVTDKIDQMLVLNGEGTKYQYTVDALENGPTGGGGGSCPTAQEIVDTWGNQSQGSYTTSGTLGFYLDAQVSSAGGGGTGLYQATVRVQDNSGDALQGARVNVDGTTLTATTGTSGEITFNLDSGVYLLEVSPPAGYDTPAGQVLTVSTSDPANTIFTLTSTLPPSGCDIPWIG